MYVLNVVFWHSSGGVLLGVVCLSIISTPQRRGGLGPLRLWSHVKNESTLM